ncbi:MAG: lauroyl acyltransferase [Alphaproteobacteria bacterium]|nr:lauroyl acyltransferase [Alphaproteobacteria bacterium]MCB9928082.1 lauroyl acyltransferase [Alphaproteobacteria bacterium]
MTRTRLQRWLLDPLEYALLRSLFGLLGLLSPEQASNLGGWVARTIGPRIPASNRIRRNLALAMPELGPAECEAIVRACWDNLGRIFGEMPHLDAITGDDRVELDPATLDRLWAAKGEGRAMIFVGAHLSNFEVFGRVAARSGFPQALIYRRANNPLVDAYFRRMRGPDLQLFPKSLDGFRAIQRVMAAGGNLGMLIDQKLNEGIAVPFFGRPAMTTPAPSQMAMRFRAVVVIGYAERMGPARYRLHAEVIDLPQPADRSVKARKAADYEATALLNRRIEAQIRAQPGNWFWLHRRWPDSKGPWPDPNLPPSSRSPGP